MLDGALDSSPLHWNGQSNAPWAAASAKVRVVEDRYAICLAGRKVGTVNLDPKRRGKVTARVAPLPGFRRVGELLRTAMKARRREELSLVDDPTPGEVAAEEGAAAVLGALRWSLVDDRTGREVPTEAIRLLKREPPHVRITW